jgi:hypothetical protein
MNVNTTLKYNDRLAKIIVCNDSESTITIQFQDNQEIKNISRRVASTLEIIMTPEQEAITGLLSLMNVTLKTKSIYEHISTRDLVYLNTNKDCIVTFYKVEKYKTKSNGTIYDITIDNELFTQLSPYSFAQSYKFYL